jgi:hypothetical protein
MLGLRRMRPGEPGGGAPAAGRAWQIAVGLALTAGVVLTACGGSATPGLTLRPADETAAPEASASTTEPPASATPAPTGARFTIRAAGAAPICKGFAKIADCAVYYRLQAKNGQAQPDLQFAGDAASAKTLAAPPDAPSALAPLTWRLRVHLDRIDKAPALPPATPQQWVDKVCETQFVVLRKTTKVDVKVTFKPDADCTIAVSLDGAPAPKP